MALITTRLGLIDEALLLKRATREEDDDGVIESVEYCLVTCANASHVTGQPTGSGAFCAEAVHRSVHVTKKRWPEGMDGAIKDLAEPDDWLPWAREFVTSLRAERARTGRPVEVTQPLTRRQAAAVEAVLAEAELGSIQMTDGR